MYLDPPTMYVQKRAHILNTYIPFSCRWLASSDKNPPTIHKHLSSNIMQALLTTAAEGSADYQDHYT